MTPEELKGLSDEELDHRIMQVMALDDKPEEFILFGMTQLWMPDLIRYLQNPSEAPGTAVIPFVFASRETSDHLEKRLELAYQSGELPRDCSFSTWMTTPLTTEHIDLLLESLRRDRLGQDEEAQEAEQVIEEAKRTNRENRG